MENLSIVGICAICTVMGTIMGALIRYGRDQITRKEVFDILGNYVRNERLDSLNIQIQHLNENIQGLREDFRSGMFVHQPTAREIVKP